MVAPTADHPRSPTNEQEAHRMLFNLGHWLADAANRLQFDGSIGRQSIDPTSHANLIDIVRQIAEVHRALYPPPPDYFDLRTMTQSYTAEQGLRHKSWAAAFPSWSAYHTNIKEKTDTNG